MTFLSYVGDVGIRRAGPPDAAALGALRAAQRAELRGGDAAQLARFADTCEAFFARELASENPWLHAWLAVRGEAVVGCAALTVLPTLPRFDASRDIDGRVRDVFVVQDERRKGIARALVLLAIDRARELDVARLGLGASAAGRPLYEALGFVAKDDEMVFAPR